MLTVVFYCEWFDGFYMTNEKPINNHFTDNQIEKLSIYIIDNYGSDLSLKELNESIYLVMENITGLETESKEIIQSLISQIRNQYYEQTKYKR